MWKIEKLISKGDYIYALVPNHPNATKNGYVLHHRIVVENHIGRLLNADEVIHHKDGNKKNNDISNLEITTNNEHARHHAKERGKTYALLKCPVCGKIYSKEKRYVDRGRYCCSRECGNKYQTIPVKDRLGHNSIIKYYKE